MKSMKSLLRKQLRDLSNPSDDELAYLALTTKIELPMRDRIAYGLHAHFQKSKYISAREWRRSDLAILHDFKPACIVEFKAMYTFNAINNANARRFRNDMDTDIEKALKIADSDTEVYSVMLATHPQQKIPVEYRGIIKYCDGVNRAYRETHDDSVAIKEEAKKSFDSKFEDKSLFISNNIALGKAFGIGVEILYWIYGPHTK